ncbi:TM2 domain-containing protein [[Mycoplasma] collis]|uniref:TM2 domain-containing protein n=1 Tax=[Mycoplasma] collis TaxID=2127 RepID=UPI00051B7CF3|nr:TM2 domain-containing protein [[Mycoplasma] collis]
MNNSVNVRVVSPKSRLITVLLSLFLGALGVDRFYTGKIMLGILKLITAGGFGVWALIDFILALTGNMRDSANNLIAKW